MRLHIVRITSTFSRISTAALFRQRASGKTCGIHTARHDTWPTPVVYKASGKGAARRAALLTISEEYSAMLIEPQKVATARVAVSLTSVP